jgi:type IV secretion system protein VirB10
VGSLTWYYANAMMRPGRLKDNAQMAMAKRAEGESPLPSLGRVGPPPVPTAQPAPPLPALFEPTMAPPEAARGERTLAEIPLAPSAADPGAANPGAPPKTPEQLALERELGGPVFVARSAQAELPPPGASVGGATSAGDLSSWLRPTATAAVRAQVLPAQRLLLPKGAFIDCTLETAIDSTLPGMTTCVMATDAFGVDGKVVLLERGTKLVGETRGQVQQGAARIFVLWTEARTPTGVIVPLDSPGADELGRAGLAGDVNRHFWQRFGAAMLVSVIDGALQAGVESSRGGSGTVVVSPQGSQEVTTGVLKDTVNIPPTVMKHHGDRIQVLVARDLDFRSVYELKSAAPH